MMRDFLAIVFPYRDLLIWVAMCVGVPSALLYLSEAVLILRHRLFRNTFYFLFIARAIPDLLHSLNSYYGYRLPTLFGHALLPLYQKMPNQALTLYYFLSSYTFQAENIAMAFMLFNRCTAVAFPLRHEKFWHNLFPLALLMAYCVPLGFTVDTFSMVATLNISRNSEDNSNSTQTSQNSTSFHIFEQSNGSFLDHSALVSAIFSVIFLAICALINMATLVAYRRQRQQQQQPQQQQPQQQNNAGKMMIPINEHLEQKLLFYTVYTFLGHMVIALTLLAIHWYTVADDSLALAALYSQYPLVSDICTVALPSWLILWASPSFRQQWLADYLPTHVAKLWKRMWSPPNQKKNKNWAIKVSGNVAAIQPSSTFLQANTGGPTTSHHQQNSTAVNLHQRGSIVTFWGALGYSWDSEVCRLFRDLRLISIGAGWKGNPKGQSDEMHSHFL